MGGIFAIMTILVSIPMLPVGLELACEVPRNADGSVSILWFCGHLFAVILSHDSDELVLNDPVMSVFRMFGKLNWLHVSAVVCVVLHDEFPDAIETHVHEALSQMVIIPWAHGAASGDAQGLLNSFDNVFRKATAADRTSSVVYSDFIRRVFAASWTDVALFIDCGVGVQPLASEMHLFLPFAGGPDDRLALSFLVQICADPPPGKAWGKVKSRTPRGGAAT
ncbi:hypothetical protein FISHEDRAFT_58824 [Fistulina hepatica ATCC 64428]|uniref:Uncharacterized protein n=1 Tax=Fistulina hepatica ATCC 64428 TaxID=1128425 RepID=A0A0D7AC10_9AGAR|nr:hypothetical protein FISHEDRAFT_58824 [Fistulina hepatica ATCC 64428]